MMFLSRQRTATISRRSLLLLSAAIGFSGWVLTPASAELIPATRIADWTPGVSVGVPGGIPTHRTRLIDVTLPPYNADRSGSTDAQPAIQAAVNAAKDDEVIYLPPGKYRINNPISIGYKRNVTVRGAGPSQTVLNYTASYGSAIIVGGSHDSPWTYKRPTITGSHAKGSTTLTLNDATVLNEYPNGGIGVICEISLENNTSLPAVHVSGYERVRKQKTRVVAKSGNTITVSPAVHFDLPASLTPMIAFAGKQAEFVGIEDLAIDATSSSTPSALVALSQAYASWVSNVRIYNTSNYLLSIANSLQCEVRKCDLRERKIVGTNGAGIIMGAASSCLIEDNIIYKIFPHMQINGGSSGNVVAYNFCESNDVFGVMGSSITSNHGPHNSFNLFEGNVASKFQSDGYFGGESEGTLFRNWFHATSDTTDKFGICVYLNRFTRNFNIVGNVLGRGGNDPATGKPLVYLYNNNWGGTTGWGGFGTHERFIYVFGLPNRGNGGFSGFGPPWKTGGKPGAGTLSQSGNVVTVTSDMFSASDVGKWIHIKDASGTSGAGSALLISAYSDSRRVTVNGSGSLSNVAYSLHPGANGYQELDGDVYLTTLLKGNYNYRDNAIPANESLNGAALPASMFRSEKPAWFGPLAWPPFEPRASTPNPTYTSIPAGHRYVHGSEPTGSGSSPAAPSNVRINIGSF